MNNGKNGMNCLVHCSDGWDRTTQLISLTQLLVDPHFRTIKGFMILIEKEWIAYGHKFGERSGHHFLNKNEEQSSPIFLQFLDVVHQLLHQFPLSFQFNQKFLIDIADNIHSCYFGTFLTDNYQVIILEYLRKLSSTK